MLTRLSRRLLAAVGMAVLTGTLVTATPGSALADTPTVHRFSASSGDQCGFGFVFGHMGWHHTHPAVGLRGTVYDYPIDNTWTCRDDGRFTVAHFVAFDASGQTIDRAAARADNAAVGFGVTLGTDTADIRIRTVVVQVCRHSPWSAVPDYCGPRSVYNHPAP